MVAKNLANKITLLGGSEVLTPDEFSRSKIKTLVEKDRNWFFIDRSNFDLVKSSPNLYYEIDTVIHLAAKVGGFFSNRDNQLSYLNDNLDINQNVIKWAYEKEIPNFIGVLSSCIYPETSGFYPMTEENILSGEPPNGNLGYALAKRIMYRQIKMIQNEGQLNWGNYIPCNMYGPYDNTDPKKNHFVIALIQKIYQAKSEKQETIVLPGTGISERQFMFCGDLVDVLYNHVQNDFNFPRDNNSINICCDSNGKFKGSSNTIKELAHIIKDVMEYQGEIQFEGNPDDDGQKRKNITAEKAFDLGIKSNYTKMKNGIAETVKWYQSNCS